MGEPLRIVTLCTGNVARSVMLGYMLTDLAQAARVHWLVRTAGTHVREDSAMSSRTRDALMGLSDLGDHHYGAHRSHQLSALDVAWADLIVATEAAHVHYVRRAFPEASPKAVQLHQFVRYAPLDDDVAAQAAAVSGLEPDATYDVRDPAGGELADYERCVNELWELAQAFSVLVLPG